MSWPTKPMTEKLVSVIMPAFNAERYIGKALESLCAQTYTNWELVVTLDGSADATGRMVAEFERQAPRNVTLLEHAQSQGPSAARNTAMDAAKGEYIAFLDADDFWTPEHLEMLARCWTGESRSRLFRLVGILRNTVGRDEVTFPQHD